MTYYDEPTFALHFGVYPTEDNEFGTPEFAGITDTEAEYPFLVQTWKNGQRAGFVTGSWACWGPADQEDGDNSLHLLVILGSNERPDVEVIEAIREHLWEMCGDGSRLLDYASISTAEDWSDERAIVTFRGCSTFIHDVKRGLDYDKED